MNGEKLRKVIVRHGFPSLAEFSRASGIPQQVVYDLVHDRRTLSPFYVRRIQDTLKEVKIDDFARNI